MMVIVPTMCRTRDQFRAQGHSRYDQQWCARMELGESRRPDCIGVEFHHRNWIKGRLGQGGSTAERNSQWESISCPHHYLRHSVKEQSVGRVSNVCVSQLEQGWNPALGASMRITMMATLCGQRCLEALFFVFGSILCGNREDRKARRLEGMLWEGWKQCAQRGETNDKERESGWSHLW